jgi:hypothetical protein
MPRTSSPEPRWDGAPLDARHEIRLAVALPLVAAAAAAAALWSHLFATGPLRWWGTAIAGAVLAAALAGAVALCFRGRSRRRWKPATVFPIAIAVGVGALVPAFEQFALAHHGVSVECTVASRIDYIAETEGGDDPRSDHEFRCVGWESPELTTGREAALQSVKPGSWSSIRSAGSAPSSATRARPAALPSRR